MSRPTELQLRFKAPEDVKLPEVAVLTKSISNLFEKLDSILPNRRVSDATSTEVNRLERKLVIKEVRYGSDLIILLLTASVVALAIPGFILASRQLRDQEMQRVAREKLQKRETTERSFRRLMKEKEADDLKKAVSGLARQLHTGVDDLLDLVGPELEAFYQTKIAFTPDELPYK